MDRMGSAAGISSMLRFTGGIGGIAVAGVIIQRGLDRFLLPGAAYRLVFWLFSGLALTALILSWWLKEVHGGHE